MCIRLWNAAMKQRRSLYLLNGKRKLQLQTTNITNNNKNHLFFLHFLCVIIVRRLWLLSFISEILRKLSPYWQAYIQHDVANNTITTLEQTCMFSHSCLVLGFLSVLLQFLFFFALFLENVSRWCTVCALFGKFTGFY